MAASIEKPTLRLTNFLNRKLVQFDRAFERLCNRLPEPGLERLVASTGASGIIVNSNHLMSTSGTGGGSVVVPEFQAGDVVKGMRGKYAVVNRFGSQGAMSSLYIVRDEAGKLHLLKVIRDFSALNLPPSKLKELQTRFKREAQILWKVNDPHIPSLIDRDPAEQLRFFVMEKINGPSLFNLIEMMKERKSDIDPITKARVISEVLQGLIVFGQEISSGRSDRYAHRDIKPENIVIELKGNLIDAEGKISLPEDPRVVLIDFGIAKLPMSTLTEASVVIGTPLYSAPEIFRFGASIANQRSDNFALGAVLYEMLTGELPFDVGDGSDAKKILDFVGHTQKHYDKLIKNPCNFVPSELMQVVMQALRPLPTERFNSYEEFKAVLDRAVQILTPKRI